MGKSWKERPNKWRHQLNKKNKNKPFRSKNKSYSPFEDPPEYHESFSGPYNYGVDEQ